MDGLCRLDGRSRSAVEKLTAVVMSATFRRIRRSDRQVTFSFSSFAAKAANPATTGDESSACGCLCVQLDPPDPPAGDEVGDGGKTGLAG